MHAPGFRFTELHSVDSTNNYARQLVHAQLAKHGDVFFAYEQTAGKGQRGRQWNSEPGSNIILSIVIDPAQYGIDKPFCLSANVSLAVRHFFGKYAGDDTRIKWPNDLYWQDRKAGGILIENSFGSINTAHSDVTSGWKWSIIGIGININQVAFPAGIARPVSLRKITGRTWNAVELAHECCDILHQQLSKLTNKNNEWLRDYNEQLYPKGKIAALKVNGQIFNATIVRVNEHGQLLINQGGQPVLLNFGEVEWQIPGTTK